MFDQRVLRRIPSVTVLLGVATAALACGGAPPDAADHAPSVSPDGVEVQTEGTSQGGMTQSLSGWRSGDVVHFGHILAGSGTRGGGGCVVIKEGPSCTLDVNGENGDQPCKDAATQK